MTPSAPTPRADAAGRELAPSPGGNALGPYRGAVAAPWSYPFRGHRRVSEWPTPTHPYGDL